VWYLCEMAETFSVHKYRSSKRLQELPHSRRSFPREFRTKNILLFPRELLRAVVLLGFFFARPKRKRRVGPKFSVLCGRSHGRTTLTPTRNHGDRAGSRLARAVRRLGGAGVLLNGRWIGSPAARGHRPRRRARITWATHRLRRQIPFTPEDLERSSRPRGT